MTAKQARKLMNSRLIIPSVPDVSQTPLQAAIDAWRWNIETAAKLGFGFTQPSHPGDELFPQLKAYFEKKGFQVCEFTSDEGYCIGDVWKVQIDWR